MSEKLEVYKCKVCGAVIEVLHAGSGELVCCGQPMERLEEKTMDEGSEKHVPVFERTETGIKVRVGAVPHPMEEKHFIEWVEVVSSGSVYREYLKPGEAPEADFPLNTEDVEMRIYCNVHGLWKG
jgi:superoxide reductase